MLSQQGRPRTWEDPQIVTCRVEKRTWQRLKLRAQVSNKTLVRVVNEAFEAYLARPSEREDLGLAIAGNAPRMGTSVPEPLLPEVQKPQTQEEVEAS